MPRAAMSLLELLVVIGAMAAIAALTLPTLRFIQHRARTSSCDALVQSVAASIATYQRRDISVPSLGDARLRDGAVRHLWDFDHARDRVLDGDPDLDPAFDAADRQAAKNVGYRGFLGATGLAVPKRSLDPATGRLIDPWGRPLRIAFAADAYGSAWFGVWSAGRDGVDGSDDDIRSWRP